MLQLRRSIVTRFFSTPSAPPICPLHRLFSAAASAVSPNPSFAVEDYLVGTCGLTRAQALKASPKLSHLKSPANSDAVLAFLAGLGLSSADIAAIVVRDPKFLCTRVEKSLTPTIMDLTGLGLSHTEIARLVSLAPANFRCRFIVSKQPYYLSLLGSTENLIRFFMRNSSLLGSSLEKVVKPNVAFLRQCGLGDCDISKLCLSMPWVLNANPKHVQAMVACAEGLGVPSGSGMFKYVLEAIAFHGEENVAAKLEYLKKTLKWSDAEVRIAVCKAPTVLRMSKDMLQRKSEFLISEVGLEPAYIAHRPIMLALSLEGRLRPRHYAVKFLKENGLIKFDWSYYSAVLLGEKAFMEKYICRHKEAAPHLAEDYADACRGQVPTKFRSA